MKTIFIKILLLLFVFHNTFAQTPTKYELPKKPVLDTMPEANILDKKQYFGFEYNNSWTSLSFGNQVEPFFFKPSLGGHLVYNRFITQTIGFGIGLGYQQRGAGIFFNDDNGDSTTRFRLRFNTIELPLNLLWRSKKGENSKWSGSVGIISNYNFEANRVYVDTGGGQHVRDNQSDNFYRFDALLSASFGVDIAMASYTVLRVQAYGNVGFLNTYRNSLSQFSGHNTLFGVKLGFLF